jgi:hypothetical protein
MVWLLRQTCYFNFMSQYVPSSFCHVNLVVKGFSIFSSSYSSISSEHSYKLLLEDLEV